MTTKDSKIQAATLASERAIDELRRQLGLIIQGEAGPFAALPVESLSQAELSDFASLSKPRLIITAARARQLGLHAAQPLSIDANALNLQQLQHLASPLANSTSLPELKNQPANDAEILALSLTKYASLLPALLVAQLGKTLPITIAQWQKIDVTSLALYHSEPLVDMLPAATARLPISGAENARIEAFRACYGASVHLALIIGEPTKEDAPLVRVHSSCITGDILGSLRCDCGDQLKLALAAIRDAGSGILLYLHQEGRGIGIVNKLRAYELQERGLDTYDANLALGFDEDERDFSLAAAMLAKLGIKRIRMLTNNPHKLAALEQGGITVAERVSLSAPAGKHNEQYLKAKAEKSGHQF